MPTLKEAPKLYDPKEVFVELCDKEFKDEIGARIALAEFTQMANSFGNRGRYPAFVQKGKNDDGEEVYKIVALAC